MTLGQFWWAGVVLTVLGTVLTSVAAAWTVISARRQRRALDRAWAKREELFQELQARTAELRAPHPRNVAVERALRPIENELRADYLARMNELVPPIVNRYVDQGTEGHFARTQALSDAIAGFWRQGVLALTGVWVGTGGAICALLSAPPA